MDPAAFTDRSCMEWRDRDILRYSAKNIKLTDGSYLTVSKEKKSSYTLSLTFSILTECLFSPCQLTHQQSGRQVEVTQATVIWGKGKISRKDQMNWQDIRLLCDLIWLGNEKQVKLKSGDWNQSGSVGDICWSGWRMAGARHFWGLLVCVVTLEQYMTYILY